jgi:PHD/YefM family antitoxin component YafN of YafNO toxin-antitoxin module
MTRYVSVERATEHFRDVLGAIASKETVVVEDNGRPVAVILDPMELEQLKDEALTRFRETRDLVQQRNADKDPAAVLRDVTRAVRSVRRERRERARSER